MKTIKFFNSVHYSSSKFFTIAFFLFIPDTFAITVSAVTAYYARFSDLQSLDGDLIPIAQFDYRIVLSIVAAGWIFFMFVTGTYRLEHANITVFNLRLVIKRTFSYFLVLGFLSFILKASFSRMVFLVMLTSGLFYLFFIRIIFYGIIIRPLIMK